MSDIELQSAVKLMRQARENARGYADFFTWSPDRDQEELGVVRALAETLALSGEAYFDHIRIRGRGEDPPDCEAVNQLGQRVAIEVTELVDGEAIKAVKNSGNPYKWADWSITKFEESVNHLIARKDSRFPYLKDGPYQGGYTVLLFTDEPMLSKKTVELYLASIVIVEPKNIDKVFLLLSYDPTLKSYPYFTLTNK
ncbi:hypothetical protein [Thalassotalea piscium]|uniref:Uncharacterized protein n=1 Tax=Thalassotalea piscium TaxID=1230533 RepID=A0A7X0NHZ8_9GAMM|nr:hypothetical protein [Thalassotalea piscium]MBB6543834.1 hypothetical protein [Thalassotalea piscium]